MYKGNNTEKGEINDEQIKKEMNEDIEDE